MTNIDNVVRWAGQVRYMEYEDSMKKIERFLRQGRLPITLIVNSQGGFIPIAYTFVKEVTMRRIPLNTLVIGRADSAAIPILLTGKIRQMEEEAHIYIHELTFSKNENPIKRKNMRDWYIKNLSVKTKLSTMEVEKMMAKGALLNAEQAKHYGFVHEIIYCE